jgi:hypothetical protein
MKSFARKLESLKCFSPHRLGLLGSILALTLLASKADAAWFTASISNLTLDSTGTIHVYFNASTECGSTYLTYVHSVVGTDDGKAMLAALLAWQAQSMQVSVYIQKCTSGDTGQFDAATGNSP